MIKRLFILILGLVSMVTVPMGFYMSRRYETFFHRALGLQVDPNYSGGTVIAQYYDDFRDDAGAGSLEYPLHQYYEEGTLDLLKYTVYQPLLDAPWSEEPHFWQLSVTMAHFSEHRDDLILRIYLDFMEGGSTSSPAPRQELVRFDQQHSWDLMAEIYAPRGQVYLYDSTGKVVDKIPLYENTEEQRYIIRLPLKGDLEQILDGRITYHAVITGFYDEISAFQPLRREASLRNSGGAADGRTPRIFDMLCIEDNSQQDILSAANPEIPFIPVIPGQIAQPSDSTYLEEIPGPTQQEIQAWENSLQKDDLDPMERGDLLFKLGRNVEALEYFTQLRKEDDNPLILAYLGTLTAQQAADKPVLEAVALVNKSFELFQEALAGNPPPRDRAYILIHRGHVSRHVPNSVFNKAVPGAQDFLGAAEILEPLGQDKSFIKELYLYAAHCYEIAEMEDLKELTLLKAKAIK